MHFINELRFSPCFQCGLFVHRPVRASRNAPNGINLRPERRNLACFGPANACPLR
jgi:hypothetical protein